MARRAFAQKPWNKVTRNDKFWVPYYSVGTDAAGVDLSTTGTPVYLVFWDPFVQNTRVTATFNFIGPGMGAVKLHRLQGHILAWLQQPTPSYQTAAPHPPPMALVDYVWRVVDKADDTHDASSFPATSMNPSMLTTGDMYEMLQRDDLLDWGTLQVHRPNLSEANPTTLWYAGQGNMVNALTKIPFPRIGKMGLNIKRGKALVCVAAARALPASSGSAPDNGLDELAQEVFVQMNFRALCSA